MLVIGEMQTELTAAQIALESMIANVDELNIVTEAVKRRLRKPLRRQAEAAIFVLWDSKESCATLRPHSSSQCQQRSSIISLAVSPWAWTPWHDSARIPAH